jgi:hydrogenase expression/formation protein HypC
VADKEEKSMCLAVPGRILSIESSSGLRMGVVDFGGVSQEVCLEYTPEAGIGDYVIVHVGFAISKLDPTRAEESLSTFHEISALPGTP